MMDDARASRRYHISGQVQGVGYRAAARHRARELGITGWARNLPDGRVEVLACGAPAALAAFELWLAHGPRFAAVSELTTAPANDVNEADFTVR